jgi:superoxide dismutase, Fe-Mn family
MSEKKHSISRRTFITSTGVAVAGLAAGLGRPVFGAAQNASSDWAWPELPYDYDALEPVIDARTMEIHHSRHHAAYVKNVHQALDSHPDLKNKPVEEALSMIPSLPEDIQVSMRNNGGGHWNHALFWKIMSPEGGGKPSGSLARAITKSFGDLESMQEQFNRAAATQFGSGWAWLSVASDGALQVTSTPNQDNPLMTGLVKQTGQPILGLDVWEHAYYLQYQNRRGDYVSAWWDVVDWKYVAELYEQAMLRR